MRVLKVLGMLLLALAVIAAALFSVWNFSFTSLPAVSMSPTEQLAALSASLSDLGSTADQELQLQAMVSQVTAADCDTLYFTANTAEGVGWKSRHFTADPRLDREEAFGLVHRSFDALDFLADTCAAQGVRLVAVLDVQALAGGLSGDQALDDEQFTDHLQNTVRDLSSKYAVSGVVLHFVQPPADSSANRARLSGVSRQCAVPLGLELPAGHPLLLTKETGADFAAAALSQEDDTQAALSLARAAVNGTGLPVIWKADDPISFSAAAYYAAGEGLQAGSCVWTSVNEAAQQSEVIGQLRQSVAQETLAAVKQLSLPAVPQELAVSYPADGAKVWSDQIYIMGTSDPTRPLTINGGQIRRETRSGAFGILVHLMEGDNIFELSQGDKTVALHLNRSTAGTGGGQPQRDGTPRLYEGTRIRITSWIASVLADPDNDDAIKETAKLGGVGVVNRCVTTMRGGRYTYAYELVSGGWVLGRHCEPINENIGPWSIAQGYPAAQQGRDEVITLVQGGTALGYDSWDEEEGLLTVTLANTTGGVSGPVDSSFLSAVEAEEVQGGVRLTFRVGGARQLWGYDVTYDEQGNTVLYLKGAPQLDLDSLRPLQGATILLDPGHGDTDTGAMGIAGALGGPAEKDVNLAVALAVRTRLEQMGAAVVMTRTDDSFPSLDDRSILAHETHPDLYLSIHHNSVAVTVDGGTVDGTCAYYFTLPGKQLADCILPQVTEAVDRVNDGSYWSYYYVTRMTYTPSILMEYGFLANPAEYEECCDPLTILREGDATARGILEFFRARLHG